MKKLWLLLLAPALGAQERPEQPCAANVNAAIAQHLGLEPAALATRTVAAACKANPDNRAEILTTQAILAPGYTAETYGDNSDDTPQWQWLVARVRDGRVQEAFSSTEEIDAALDIGGLTLDTAPYRLNGQTRAFAVRFSNRAPGPSAPEAGKSEEFHLFASVGGQLRHLAGFATDPWEGSDLDADVKKKCPACVRQQAGDFVMDVDKKSAHQGFADLSVSARLSGDDANGAESPLGRATVALRYDGQRYQPTAPKWWLQPGWLADRPQ